MDTKALRQRILDLAIRGRLVPQDPADEPASKLLCRIREEKEKLVKEGKIKESGKKGQSDKEPEPDDISFELPAGWLWTTLGELCSFLSRGRSPRYKDEDKTYPVFAQKCNLRDGGISLDQARFLDPLTVKDWDEVYKLKTNDILINSTGTGTVCRTRIFNENCLGKYPFVVPDSHVSVVRTFNSIEPNFVLVYLSSFQIQKYLEHNLAGSTNQKELYIDVLKKLPFPLPPLAEQHRIVKKIEELFGALTQLTANK